MIRGALGESYCSQECKSKGYAAIWQFTIGRVVGVCTVCGKPVQLAVREEDMGFAIPFNGQTMYICNNRECIEKAKEHVSKATICSVCRKPITE